MLNYIKNPPHIKQDVGLIPLKFPSIKKAETASLLPLFLSCFYLFLRFLVIKYTIAAAAIIRAGMDNHIQTELPPMLLLLHCAYTVIDSVTFVAAVKSVPLPSACVFQPLKL